MIFEDVNRFNEIPTQILFEHAPFIDLSPFWAFLEQPVTFPYFGAQATGIEKSQFLMIFENISEFEALQGANIVLNYSFYQ